MQLLQQIFGKPIQTFIIRFILPELVFIWTPFEREKIEVRIFDRAILSGLVTREFTTKEDLNPRRQVPLLKLMPWHTHVLCGNIYIRNKCKS